MVVDFSWWIWVMKRIVLPNACCGLYVFWPLLEQLRFKSVLPSSLVSDFPSQLEAFWTLSLISLGRLEYICLFCYIIGSIYTTISVMQGIQTFVLMSAFLPAFASSSFVFVLNFLFLLLFADLWLFPPVCLSLPFWDITLLIQPGENSLEIIHIYSSMWARDVEITALFDIFISHEKLSLLKTVLWAS